MMGFLKSLFGIGPKQLKRVTLYAVVYQANPDSKRNGARWRLRLVTSDGKVLMNRSGFNAKDNHALIALANLISESNIEVKVEAD